MKTRRKKSTPEQDDAAEDKAARDWWRTPAIITAILALVGTIITTLPSFIREINETRSAPAATIDVTESNSVLPSLAFCNDFFTADAVEIQTGVPRSLSIENNEIMEIKLMDGSVLVGGVKYLVASRTVVTSDQICNQVKPHFTVEPGRENEIAYDGFVLLLTYDEINQSLELKLASK